MATLDTLPGDQRAVLALVLGRGRSYDEIARLLSIDPDAVRERARAAMDALGPHTRVSQANRQMICDYLLGQLPERDVPAVRELVAHSAADRAWARVLSGELAPLASSGLPEIPLETGAPAAPASAPDAPVAPAVPSSAPAPTASSAAGPASQAPEAPAAPPPEAAAAPVPAATPVDVPPTAEGAGRRRFRRAPRTPKPPKPPKPPKASRSSADGDAKRSSRLGGMLVILVTVIIIALVVVLLVRHHHTGASRTAHTGGVTTTNPATASSTTSTAPTTSTTVAAKPVAQINLTPTSSGSKALAIADVLQQGSVRELAIVGQDIPANTQHNSYEVWLYNSPGDAVSLGFVDPGVNSNGKLSTAGALPSDAAAYHRLIITTETVAHPKRPGPILLSGALRGL